MSDLIRSFSRDKLKIEVYGTESGAGEASAEHVTNLLKSTLAEKGKANLILATGTSQLSFLEALIEKEIDWGKITIFHLDEYKGMSDTHPASFRKYLKERITVYYEKDKKLQQIILLPLIYFFQTNMMAQKLGELRRFNF